MNSPGPMLGGGVWNPLPPNGIPGGPEGGPPPKPEDAGLNIEGGETGGAAGAGPEGAVDGAGAKAEPGGIGPGPAGGA
jgi:hypothetical protein